MKEDVQDAFTPSSHTKLKADEAKEKVSDTFSGSHNH
jgi:hypothetical protein